MSHFLISVSPSTYHRAFISLVSDKEQKEIPLTDLGPIYTAAAYLGTPSVPIRIEFDTGSPAAYIYSKQGC